MSILSESERRRLAGRARTLQERLDADAASGERVTDLDEVLDEWRDHVADGDPETFRKRLDREGLDAAECRERVGANGWPSDEPLPEWVDGLDEALAFALDDDSVEVDLETESDAPFAHLLAPFLEYARREVGDASDHLTAAAMDDLVNWLGERLTKVCSHTLFIEFKTYIAERDPDLVFDDPVEIDEGSTEYYEAFTETMLDGELKSFFLEYSFLARLFVTSIRQWIAAVETFLARAARDADDLRDTFGDGDEIGKVDEISALGDPHHAGQRVLGVTFESGTRIAYKPRNSGIAAGFYDLLEWINRNGDLPTLRTLEFLARDDYAWMEWVQPEPCSTREEVRGFYRRAGMFMCLFYALDATDMHLENIIAEGDQPVVIDLETLAQPTVKPEKRSINETVTVVGNTVLRTGAVPRHVPSADVGDMSGFSAQQVDHTIEAREFTDVNTDRMELQQGQEASEGENLPRYEGETVRPRAHTDAIVRGFGELYEFVLDNKRAILDEDGPIERLAEREARVRVLYRPTRAYSYVKNSLMSQSNHRTGLDFGVKAEQLAKLVVSEEIDQDVWSLYETEREVLRRFNTPRFNAKIDSADVYDGDEVVVEDFLERRPIDQIRDRIESFDATDLSEQTDYIEWGYATQENAHADPGTTPVEVEAADDFERVAADASRGAFDRLVAASRTDAGHPTWIGRKIGPNGGVNVHEIGDGLYDGRAGIGAFAAALDAVFDDERYGEFASDAVEPLVAGLREGDAASRRPSLQSIGGAAGLGSVVYGLTKMAELLDANRYVRAAERAAASIRAERIENDAAYDVMRGSAGAILGLLALYDATGDRDALNRAARAGEHLLENRTEHSGVRAWRSAEAGRPLCGFSHGVAGIAYALYRLGAATGESRFRSAALESIEYERRQYDETRRNWPDLRDAAGGRWIDAWCHGRTGVGLARLGMYEIDPVPELRDDVDRALRGVEPGVLTDADHVCCGNFGRVELLLRAARTLGESAYRGRAERLATASVERTDATGQFSTQWQTRHWNDPGFFSGEAGIGYSLLRLVDDSLPCVLLWE